MISGTSTHPRLIHGRPPVPWMDADVEGADGEPVRLRVYEPVARPAVTLVWAHGGSWTRGSIESWHDACEAMAALGSARIISVGYRLAPQWAHPTAVMDVAAALQWSQQTFQTPVLAGGDSAGGTLAAGAALWFRDNRLHLDGLLLAYPPLDPECDAASYHHLGQPFPPRAMLREAWQDYAGTDEDLRALPYLSPVHVENLEGLCRTSLLVGPTDPVRDDVAHFAARLEAASVPVSVCTDPAVFHGQFLDAAAHRINPVHGWVQAHLVQFTQTPDIY
ncbi:alpha/beta hydrolase fold domain-containing protein [Pseudarthrobacter oxydans]|uniref:alpha/beta hydrolase fold domain-containing protein n=1 Tax=Pseudarthrobacter oxydans TaxID=1671 RepID=UPI00343080DB